MLKNSHVKKKDEAEKNREKKKIMAQEKLDMKI